MLFRGQSLQKPWSAILAVALASTLVTHSELLLDWGLDAAGRLSRSTATRLAAFDMERFASRLGERGAGLREARSLAAGLKERLARIRADRDAMSRELAQERQILAQIHALLRDQPGDVVSVDGRTYDRGVVEEDAQVYLKRCVSHQRRVREYEGTIAGLVRDIARAEGTLDRVESDLREQQIAFDGLRSREEARTVLARVEELADSEETRSIEARLTETLALPTEHGAAPDSGELSELTTRVTSYLRSSPSH